MSKRQPRATPFDLAVKDLDEQIAVLQLARKTLLAAQPKTAPRRVDIKPTEIKSAV